MAQLAFGKWESQNGKPSVTVDSFACDNNGFCLVFFRQEGDPIDYEFDIAEWDKFVTNNKLSPTE